jgi:hypothetical protein
LQRQVIAQLTAEAPRLRRARQRGRQAVGAAVLLSAAAVAMLIVRARQSATPSEPAAVVANLPACALPIIDEQHSFVAAAQARRELTLGGFGVLVASEASEVKIERSGACELVLRLQHGLLAGELHSLKPARLTIRTPQGAVVVTGTRFSVRSDDEFEVLLAAGVVDVVFPDRSALRMSPGTRLRKPATERQPKPQLLTAADAQQLAAILDAPLHEASTTRTPEPAATTTNPPEPAATTTNRAANADLASAAKPTPLRAAHETAAPSPNPDTTAPLLAAAEAARRAGRIADARSAYGAASRGQSDAAEVALLRWVRLELDEHAPANAQRLLDSHQRRFTRGRLGAEAGFQQVQVFQALGELDRAKQAARELLARYPETPQAAAARQLLQAP